MLVDLALACAATFALGAPISRAVAPAAWRAPVAPEERELTISESAVTVRAACWWPAQAHKGWVPCEFTVTNGDARARSVSLHASAWDAPREVDTTVELFPGERASLEILLPVFANAQNQFTIGGELDGQRFWLPGTFGPTEPAKATISSVLYLSGRAPDAGEPERWASALSTFSVGGEDSNHRVEAEPVSPEPPDPSVPTAEAAADNVRVHAVLFAHLPAHSEAYSSVDVVVVDASDGLPDERAFAPLAAWLRLGGTLAIFGKGGPAVASASRELAPWLEPRFATETRGTVRGWRAGLGLLLVDDAPAFSTGDQTAAVRFAASLHDGVVHDASGSRMFDARPALPDPFKLPYGAFALLLVVFALVIGPLNFVLVARTKRPVLLLVTIPAIALIAALAVLAFGIASQGLGVDVASRSLAWLDQREHRSMASELRAVFAGLAPARGLEPGPGSSVHAISIQLDAERVLEPRFANLVFRSSYGPELVLSGGWLPSRLPFTHQTLTERAERGRLELARDGGALAATNALGTRIQDLLVRDPDGAYWTLAAPLEPAARARLEPLAAEDADARGVALQLGKLAPGLTALPVACYVASLERSPFTDDCGVRGEEVVSNHCVLGVLAADAKEWR